MSQSSVDLSSSPLKFVLSLYGEMKRLYRNALELGEKVFVISFDDIPQVIEERNRILNRIGEIQAKAETLVEENRFTGSALAQLQEARHQIKDLKPLFHEQLFKMNKYFIPQLKSKRTEMISVNKSGRAALAYVKSPGFFKGK